MKAWDDGAWVREAALAHARKQRSRRRRHDARRTACSDVGRADASRGRTEWPLWEVFVRSKAGLDHKHCGSLHAADAQMAIQMARDVYTRRQEGSERLGRALATRSSPAIPADKAMYFDPTEDKVYRHPTFYELPEAVDHM